MSLREQNGHAATVSTSTASHHRTGSYFGIHPEDTPITTSWQRQTVRGQQRTEHITSEPMEIDNPPRLPSSARRYRSNTQEPPPVMRVTYHQAPVMKARSSAYQITTRSPRSLITQETQTRPRRPRRMTDRLTRRRYHWCVYVGVMLIACIAGWVMITLVLAWWGTVLDDWHYGRPRTAQYDVVVGHGDSPTHQTHFVAVNIQGQAYILEIQGGDGSHSNMYEPPRIVGTGTDLDPVTLDFRDINGDHHPDMLVYQGTHLAVYINEPDKRDFRPVRQDEQVQL